MKIQKLILTVFICLIYFTCCNNDDNVDPNILENHAIHGSWNLTNVTGGFVGINLDYNLGEVIWTFNETNNQLFVENNIITTGPEDIYAGLDTGNYIYEIQEVEDTEILFIDTNERGHIIISGTTLTIDDGFGADGFLTTFER